MVEPPGTAPGSSPVITSAFIAIAGKPAPINIGDRDGDMKGWPQDGLWGTRIAGSGGNAEPCPSSHANAALRKHRAF